MPQKLNASMPDTLDLDQDWQILFTAVDAVSGDPVPDVKISQASLVVSNVSGNSPASLENGPFMLVPGPNS